MYSANKLLATTYLVFAIIWFLGGALSFFTILPGYHRTPLTVVYGILLGLGILFLYFVHRKAINNTQGLFREKSLVSFSILNATLIATGMFGLFGGLKGCGECSFGFFWGIFLPPLLIFTNFFTFLFGIATVVRISKRFLFWTVFLIIATLVFFYLKIAVGQQMYDAARLNY